MSVAPHDERERLLPRNEPSAEENHRTPTQFHRRYWKRGVAAVKNFRSRPSAPVLCCTFALYFLISFSRHIIEVPTIRLFELAACHEFYSRIQGAVDHDGDIHKRLCKAPAVQNELSTLTGWKFGLDAVYVPIISPCGRSATYLQDWGIAQTWPLPSHLLRLCCGEIWSEAGSFALLHGDAPQSYLDSPDLLARWPRSDPSGLAVFTVHIHRRWPESGKGDGFHHCFGRCRSITQVFPYACLP